MYMYMEEWKGKIALQKLLARSSPPPLPIFVVVTHKRLFFHYITIFFVTHRDYFIIFWP